MSITYSARVRCPCGGEREATLVRSLNAERHPALRVDVLERRLHVFACAACGGSFAVPVEMLYVDLGRRQLLGLFPEADRGRERACAESLQRTYERWFVRDAPAAIRRMAGDILVRVCFGYEELREKLVIDEAGLSDLVVEALKCELLLDERLQSDGVAAPRLEWASPEVLAFVARTGAAAGAKARSPARSVEVDRAMYDALDRPDSDVLAKHPGLASGPHVSLLRLVP